MYILQFDIVICKIEYPLYVRQKNVNLSITINYNKVPPVTFYCNDNHNRFSI